MARQVPGDRLGKRRLSGSGCTRNQHATLALEQSLFEFFGVFVVVDVGLGDWPHGGNFDAVGERWAGDGNPVVSKLDDRHPRFGEFNKALAGLFGPIDDFAGVVVHRLLVQWLLADRLISHLPDSSAFGHRFDVGLEVDAHRLVVEVLLDIERADGSNLRRNVFDSQSFGLGDFRLDEVAREERRLVFLGEIANQRIDLAFACVAAFDRVRAVTDVLEGDRSCIGQRCETL